MLKKMPLALVAGLISTTMLTGGPTENAPTWGQAAQAARVISQYNMNRPAYVGYVKNMDMDEIRKFDYSTFMQHYKCQRYAVRGHATDKLDFTFYLRGKYKADTPQPMYIAIYNRTGKSDIKITVDHPEFVKPLPRVGKEGRTYPSYYVLKGHQKVLLAMGPYEYHNASIRITGRLVDESGVINHGSAPIAADIMFYTEFPEGFALQSPGINQAHPESSGGWWEKWDAGGKKIGPFFQVK